jgi:hypothetical protein
MWHFSFPHPQYLTCSSPIPFPDRITPACFPLLISTFEYCSLRPPWSDPAADHDFKQGKEAVLSDLKSRLFVRREDIRSFRPDLIESFFRMINSNLFTPISALARSLMVGDSEPLVVETAWPHLAIVYNLLHSFFHACPRDSHFDVTFAGSLFSFFNPLISMNANKLLSCS